MNTTARQTIKFCATFLLVAFWTEHLTHDTYIALAVGLIGALLSLRAGKGRITDEKYERVFVHFTAFHDESHELYMKALHPDCTRKKGLYLVGETAYLIRCTIGGTSADELIKIIKRASRLSSALVIYGNEINGIKIKELSPIPVEIRPVSHLIRELEEKRALPSIPEDFARSVRGEKPLGRLRRAFYLLISAVLMVITAPTSGIREYMLIWSSVLIIMALVLAIRKPRQAKV